MAFNFLLKEDGGYLLQEIRNAFSSAFGSDFSTDPTQSKLIISDQLISQKINLEVKRTVATSTDVEYTFRLTSHDPDESIDLSNYRIVQYLNVRWPGSLTYALGQSPTPFGGADTDLAVFESPTYINFISEDNPPNIYPEYDRFSVKIVTKFVQGILPVSGSGFEGNSIRTHEGIQAWSTNADGKYDYEPEHCYTSTTAVDYEDNHTFVLEYNDTSTNNDPESQNWNIVTEYVTSGSIDQDTSVYPLGEDGDNTKTYNRMVFPTKDNTIKELYPDTVFNSESVHTLHKGLGENERILEYYPINIPFQDQVISLGSSAESLTDVKAVEFWKYTVNSFEPTTMDLTTLSADFNTETATWNTEVLNVSSTISNINMTGLSTHDNLEFARWKISDIDLIKSWMMSATSAENHGVVTSYNNETSPSTIEGPYFAALDTVLGDDTMPAFVINTKFITGGEQTWIGSINSNWSNPGNWSNNILPDTNSIAVFDGLTSTNQCILDSNQSIYNLQAINNSGSISLSSFDLTIEGSEANFLGLSALTQKTGGTLIITGNCLLSIGQSVDLKTLEITETSNVEYHATTPLIITENFNVSGTCLMYSDIVLRGCQTSFGDSAIIETDRSSSAGFYFLVNEGASLSESGTISAGVTYQKFDNNITARAYKGKVLVSTFGAASGARVAMTFDAGQHTYFDGLCLENYIGQDGLLTIDSSANDPSILITNRRGLETSGNYIDPPLTNFSNDFSSSFSIGVGIDPPLTYLSTAFSTAFSSSFGKGIYIEIIMGTNDWIIDTGKIDVSTIGFFDLGGGGGFNVSGDVESITPQLPGYIMPPLIINSSTEVIDINNNMLTQNFIMNIGSTINFNHFNINAIDEINISGNSESVNILSGTSLFATNINIVGDPLDYIDLSTEEFWYVSASDTLDAVHVDLKSSDASGGVTGIAVRSNDLGEP